MGFGLNNPYGFFPIRDTLWLYDYFNIACLLTYCEKSCSSGPRKQICSQNLPMVICFCVLVSKTSEGRGLILLWFWTKGSPFEIAKLNGVHSYMPQKSLPYSIRGRKQIKGTTNHITRRQSLLCRFTSSGRLLYFKNEGQS